MMLVYSVVLDLYKGAKHLFRDAAYFASLTGDLKKSFDVFRSPALESGLRFTVITVQEPKESTSEPIKSMISLATSYCL